MTYTVELELPLRITVCDALHGVEATRDTPAEPDWIELVVQLGALDVTEALPPEVLATLEDDALERLRRAADEP